jgi:hypothetical protein
MLFMHGTPVYRPVPNYLSIIAFFLVVVLPMVYGMFSSDQSYWLDGAGCERGHSRKIREILHTLQHHYVLQNRHQRSVTVYRTYRKN